MKATAALVAAQAVDKSARLQKCVARRRCKAAPRLQKSVARPHHPAPRTSGGVGRSGFEAALRLHPTLFCGALHLFLWIAPCATFFWSHPLGEKRRDVDRLSVVLFSLCLQSEILSSTFYTDVFNNSSKRFSPPYQPFLTTQLSKL